MGKVDSVQLHITDKAGRVNGTLTISLLPNTKTKDNVWPLLDERDNPDRDPSVEPVQLLEGQEYLYEIEVPEAVGAVTTDQESVFYPDDRKGLRGRLRTNLYTGTLQVCIAADGRELGTVSFEIRSRKVDYLSQYRWMLRDIADGMAELIMQSFAPSEQRFSLDDTRDAATLYQRFAFLKSLVMDESLDDAITHIVNRPHRAWVQTSEWRSPNQPIPASSAIARQMARPGPRVRAAGSGTIPYPLPARFEVVRTRETLDTEPNRFVRFALNQWRHVVQQISDALRSSRDATPRAIREVQNVLDHLDRYLEATDFPELSHLTRFPADNVVLHRAEGYRTILQLYLQFELAAKLTWQGGDDVYHAGQRDVATLYEYWVYFQLAKIVAGLTNVTLDYSELLQPSSDGMSINLKKGRKSKVRGTLTRLGRKLHIEFWFNRVFPAKGKDGSWTRAMQPDFSLKITPTEKGAEYAATWIHFDAKYRVETVTELFGKQDTVDDGAATTEATPWDAEDKADETFGDAEEPSTGRPLRADLLKMHAYRDAIRRSSGAYVIYPGTDRELAQEYHEILPGLGAFALRPTQDGDAEGTSALTKFIEDVMNHVASQVTQHERERFWVHEAHTGRPPQPRVQAAPFLKKPPADTPVLLGFVKDAAHLAWIRQTGRYNLRADGRTGSVGLQGPELGAELVVLYGPPLEVAQVWRVVDGPQVMTRQRMIDLGYPTPRGELYICLPVERVEDGEWKERLARGAIEEIRNAEKPDAQYGAPVVTSWLRVMVGL